MSSDSPTPADVTPPKPPSLKPPSVPKPSADVTPPSAPTPPVVPAAPPTPTPEPAAVVTPPVVVAEPPVKVEPLKVRVIKGFAFPANGITVYFQTGFIVEDVMLAKQMLNCGMPVQLLSDKEVNVCPACKHVFSKE